MPTAPSPVACPTCGASLLGGGISAWCPQCALGAAMDVARKDGALFSVPGHIALSELGRGAAGIVYRARQEQPAREVALKILRPHEAGSAESLARFRLEAATIAALDHPGILPVLSVGEHDGLPYFTMKLCLGTLAQRVGKYHGCWREAAALVALIADAVQHAHARGVLHRDLKPGNVLFDEADRPFVSDFGLAKLTESAGAGGPATRPLLVMGTPGYLAPEVLADGAGAATTAADVFALGAILHELLTGAPPPAGTAAETPRPGVPRDLAVICAHALAAEPGRRYATAAALVADLRAWLSGRPISARPVSATERAVAWARRNPALATVSAALLLAVIAGATVLTLKNHELRRALAAAKTAETQAEQSLAEALVAQARAVRQSGREGQRREALALLRRAAAIRLSPEARKEAIAALLLPDWDKDERVKLWSGTSNTATPSPDFSCLLVEDHSANFTLYAAGGPARWSWQAPVLCASDPVFSPDGRWLAVRLRDDTVHVLQAEDGRALFQLTGRPYAFKGSVWRFGKDMDFSPDGKILAVTRPEGGVTFHAMPGGEPAGEWSATEWITTMQFSPDGQRLAVGGAKERKDSLLGVIEVPSGKLLAREKTSGRMEFAAWTPDGRWLACRPAGGFAEVRSSANLAVRATLPDREALHGKFLPDGERLLLTKQLLETKLWEVARGNLLLSKHDAGRPGNWWHRDRLEQWRSFTSGPVVRHVLVDSPVLRTSGSTESDYSIREHGWPMDRSPEGEWIAIGGWGGGTVLRADTGERVLRVFLADNSDAGMLRFDPSGAALWVSLAKKGLHRLPLARTDKGGLVAGPAELIDDEKGWYLTARNHASGHLALVNPDAGEVKIIDARAGKMKSRWKHPAPATAEFSPDGSQVVVGSTYAAGTTGRAAAVYAVATGERLRALGAGPGRQVRWSPGGKWVLTSEGKDQAFLWRASDWSPGPALPKGKQGEWATAAFSTDDKALVYWTGDAFELFDLGKGVVRQVLPLPAGSGFVFDLTWDEGRRLWAVNGEGRVQLWDLAAMEHELATLGLGTAPPR